MKNKKRKEKKGIWKQGVDYLKECRSYIYLTAGLFFAAGLFGFVFADYLGFFDPILKDLISKVEGLTLWELIWFIFKNNVSSAFVAMFAGIFLGVIPIFNALTNGALGGYVYALASSESGYGSIVYLLPHGIFELPAIFIALGLGIKLGMFVLSPRGKRIAELKRRLIGSIKTFLVVVLPLLILAAIIEGFLISLGRG